MKLAVPLSPLASPLLAVDLAVGPSLSALAQFALRCVPVDRLLLARIVTHNGLAERLLVPGRRFELGFLSAQRPPDFEQVQTALHGNVAQIVTSVEKPLEREADPLVYR